MKAHWDILLGPHFQLSNMDSGSMRCILRQPFLISQNSSGRFKRPPHENHTIGNKSNPATNGDRVQSHFDSRQVYCPLY